MKITFFPSYGGKPISYDSDLNGQIIPLGDSQANFASFIRDIIPEHKRELSKSYYLLLNKTNFNKFEKDWFIGTYIVIGKYYLVRIDNCYIHDYGKLKEISIDEANFILGFDEEKYLCQIKKDKNDAYEHVEEYLETKDENLIFVISYIKPIELTINGIEGISVTDSVIIRDVFSLEEFFCEEPLRRIKKTFLPIEECENDYNKMINNIIK